MLGVLAVQHKVACGIGYRVFNQRAREQQAARVGELGTGFGHQLDTALRGIGQADVLERVQRGVMDFDHIGIA